MTFTVITDIQLKTNH